MKCLRCQHENPAAQEHCGGCGASIAHVCTRCGTGNPTGQKFCGECGAALGSPTGAPVRAPAAEAPERAERRQLTVMFCDLVGSTALSERLDPEDLRGLMRSYQQTIKQVVERYDGHVAQYLGDGVMVYCGWPQAHEDDAERAVRVGLEAVQAVKVITAPAPLRVRVGIATGTVVVGESDDPSAPRIAVGETPNLAARVQGLAGPDEVVIAPTTYRLLGGVFEYADLGRHTLKGIVEPVRAWRVLGPSHVQGRFEAARVRGLTPLVGREEELGLLRRRWTQAKERQGHVVLISGEPGIGKSRLLEVMKTSAAADPHTSWECRCSPYHQHSALHPLIDLYHRELQLRPEDTPEAKLRNLEQGLARYGLAHPETVSLWASLLSVPLPDRYPPLTLTAERQKQKTLEAVLTLLLAQAAQQPVLMIVEDLHWIDPSTLEWLTLVLDRVPAASVLMLLTLRPHVRPPWAARAHVTHVTVSRFTREQTAVMVDHVVRGKTLPSEVLEQVVAKTDGVPLFVEELTTMVLESGLLREEGGCYELTAPLPALAIPATLQDSLTARLDRLTTAKEVAQLGAILGRTFPYELLRAVSPADEPTLQRELGRLVDAELLYQRGRPPHATYLFKHALIQEAAYQSLLKSTRQQYHQRIAQVLAEHFPQLVDRQPELLARHYSEAGLIDVAIPCWQRAGELAVQRSAYVEAIAHLTQGLALLAMLPATPARLSQELDLQVALGPALMATKGMGASDTEHAYARAQELCRQMGDTPKLFPVLRGLLLYYQARGQLQTAYRLGEEILRRAHSWPGSAFLALAHQHLGMVLFFQGEPASARTHHGRALATYAPREHRAEALRSLDLELGVAAGIFLAWELWYLGYPDEALRRSQEALALAREASHPYSLAFAMVWAAVLHQHRREPTATHEQAEAAMALAREQGFAFFLARGTVVHGWALAMQGQDEAGIAEIRQGVAADLATGSIFFHSYYLGLLAEAHAERGHLEAAVPVLDEALAATENTEVRFYRAELFRLKGEALRRRMVADDKQAEACLQQSLAIARRQQARSLELRAATSLARLWQKQGKRHEAHQVLAPICGWFTEGFDTPDLRAADTLLQELA